MGSASGPAFWSGTGFGTAAQSDRPDRDDGSRRRTGHDGALSPDVPRDDGRGTAWLLSVSGQVQCQENIPVIGELNRRGMTPEDGECHGELGLESHG